MAKQTFKTNGSIAKMDRILKAIRKTPMTRLELMAKLHISLPSAQEYIKHMHSLKMIYIADWNHEESASCRSYLRAMYRAGDLPDAPKPPKFTSTENSYRRYHRIKETDEDKYHEHLERSRHYKKMLNFKPKRDIASFWIVK